MLDMSLLFLSSLIGKAATFKFNPSGRSGVLYFHRVLDKPSDNYPDDPTIDEFDELLSVLKNTFTIVSLKELASTRQVSRGKPLLGISFDDGYRDNFTNALPVLIKHGLKATFFIASQGTEEGILWQDKIIECVRANAGGSDALYGVGGALDGLSESAKCRYLMEYLKRMKVFSRNAIIKDWEKTLGISSYPRLMLTREEIKVLSNEGHDIGGHTHNHVILSVESQQDVKNEITRNKDILEEIIGRKLDLFCYPNGHPSFDLDADIHPEMLREAGYSYAFTTLDGGIGKDSDDMLLSRFLPHRRNSHLRAWSSAKIMGEVA
ncbi:MAG: hypothetical protein CBC55_05155 [Gammaproteobacteria bacterium TMED95]|nr:MAG: hypothetical protein CBC55_05155 [Gammaproteobacteria bacterium TMED95]